MLPIIIAGAVIVGAFKSLADKPSANLSSVVREHRAEQPTVLVGAKRVSESHPFPYKFDGYVFHLPKGADWKTAPNDDWEITTVSPRVRPIGQRYVDDTLVRVFADKSGNHYAACAQVAEGARVGGRPAADPVHRCQMHFHKGLRAAQIAEGWSLAEARKHATSMRTIIASLRKAGRVTDTDNAVEARAHLLSRIRHFSSQD
jgi:hypothetical protein